jgi:hypothetical protein
MADHIDRPESFLSGDEARLQLFRIGAVEPEQPAGRTELGIVRCARVVGDRNAADRGPDRDGEESEHQDLLPPLAAKHPPGPADDCAPGSDATLSRPMQLRGVRDRRYRRSPVASSDSGPGSAAV